MITEESKKHEALLALEQKPQKLAIALGDNMKLYRKQKGYQQNELADILGVSPNYISLIESGKKYPSLKTIAAIANALSVSVTDLLTNDHLIEDVRVLLKKYNRDRIIDSIEQLTGNEKNRYKTSDCA